MATRKSFLTFTLSILSIILVFTSATPAAFAIDKVGDSTDETLTGTDTHDYISGEGGNDTINGLAGPDSLYGRDGNDILNGGSGFDKLSGGMGNDQLFGEAGDDTLTGGLGADTFDCGPGVDTITDFKKYEGDTKNANCENAPLKKIIWYNPSIPNDFGAVQHLQDMGMIVETRTYDSTTQKIDNIADANLVIIDFIDYNTRFSPAEVATLKDYVNNGGRVMLTPDTHYFYCDPATGCPHEVAREFGFAFTGDVQRANIRAAQGQYGNSIWTTPNTIPVFTDWCCDPYIGEILDTTHVRVIGMSYDDVNSSRPGGGVKVHDPALIVVNEDPAFNGGKVMGIGRNMFLGDGSDERMVENVVIFMLK